MHVHILSSLNQHKLQTNNWLDTQANIQFTMKFSTNAVLIHEEKKVCLMTIDTTALCIWKLTLSF